MDHLVENLCALMELVFCPAWVIAVVKQRRRAEDLAGTLLFRSVRPWARAGRITALAMFLVPVMIAWGDAASGEESLAYIPRLVMTTALWIGAVVAVFVGPYHWNIEFRERGILTSTLWPWEAITSISFLEDGLLHLSVKGLGGVDLRLQQRDLPAVRALLEDRRRASEVAVDERVDVGSGAI